jgi:hypothetical protein
MAWIIGCSHSGPVIFDRRTAKPYRQRKFAKCFRKVARAAGVPDTIWIMDAQAGVDRRICEGRAADRRYGPRNAYPACNQPPLFTQPACGDEPCRHAPSWGKHEPGKDGA